MIPQKEAAYEVQGVLPGRAHKMHIADEFMEHAMAMLTDMYSRPREAILREYATNALDAQIESGNTVLNGFHRPVTGLAIDIELPGPLSQFLKIRDYGIGLNEEDIANIYSSYGASTKRGTNAQNGMLGIGCKSGLAYADQFTLVSVKDGMQTTVVVSRTDSGGGECKCLGDPVPVDRPDGTEIVIPAQRSDTFEAEASKLFQYWPKGSVKVNGQEPERLDGLWVNDDMCIIDGDYYENNDILVMANVAYPIERDHFNSHLPNNSRLVFFVPTGSVKFHPSRESLIYNDLTKKCLAGIQEKFRKACAGRVQVEIDKQPSPAEARKTMIQWNAKLPSHAKSNAYTYKGQAIPSAFEPQGKKLVVTDKSAYRLSNHTTDRAFPIESFDRALFVQNYDRPTFTPGQKKKLNHWLESQNGAAPDGIRMYVLYEGVVDPKWIGKDRIIEWSTIEAVKLPRTVGAAKGSSGRIPGSYDFFENSADNWRTGVPADDIDQSKPILWYEGSPWDTQFAHAAQEAYPNGFTLVRLTANRIDKFTRSFPTAERIDVAMQREAKAWYATLSKETKFAMSVATTSRYNGKMSTLDASKVDDPDLKKWITAMKKDIAAVLTKKNTFNNAGAVLDMERIGQNPLTNYKLIDNLQMYSLGSATREHLYIYLNAAYAADKKGV